MAYIDSPFRTVDLLHYTKGNAYQNIDDEKNRRAAFHTIFELESSYCV
jgi:hypothetical protein